MVLSDYFLSEAISSGQIASEQVVLTTTQYVKFIDEDHLTGIMTNLDLLIENAISST
jgi:hypothetical protein